MRPASCAYRGCSQWNGHGLAAVGAWPTPGTTEAVVDTISVSFNVHMQKILAVDLVLPVGRVTSRTLAAKI